MRAYLLPAMCGLLLSAEPAFSAPPPSSSSLTPAAQVSTPPSPTKVRLIRRYLELLGVEHQIETGSFLERYAFAGGPIWQAPTRESAKPDTFMGVIKARMTALKSAYYPHRSTYQQAYDNHVNWEFTEEELAEIVGFLERPVGRHFLDGRWRMEAYVGTDTEDLDQQIVKEAAARLAK